MLANIHYEQCLSFLNSQIKPNVRKPAKAGTRFRAVTISRDAGSGGNAIAELLVKRLLHADPNSPAPWTLFNKNLVEKVLEDHQIPKRLAKFFPEDRLLELQDMMDEIVGLRPGSWTIAEKTSETILQLAAIGNVVIVGRAGNVVTRKLPDVLRVRLTGSFEARTQRLMAMQNMSHDAALRYIDTEDTGRRRYLRKYFSVKSDDPLLYHLVLNTDHFSLEQVADLLAEIVIGD
ncbi:MAG: hypothetical protein RLY20_3023 [Verrucomicrobiota bacterium]|jgi:cytidylate kinase